MSGGTLKRGFRCIQYRGRVRGGEKRAYLTVQASAVVAHLASDATLFRHRSVQLFARLVKDLGRFCSIIFARRVVPGVLSTLVLLHLGCVLQPRLKSHRRDKKEKKGFDETHASARIVSQCSTSRRLTTKRINEKFRVLPKITFTQQGMVFR